MINVSLPGLFGGSQRWMVLCLLYRVTCSCECCYIWFKGWHTVVNVAVSGLGSNIQWWMLLCLVQGITYSGEWCSGFQGHMQWWMLLCLIHRVTCSGGFSSAWFIQVRCSVSLSGLHRLHTILLCLVHAGYMQCCSVRFTMQWWMLLCLVYGVHSDEWYTVCFAGLHAAVNVALFDLQGHMQWCLGDA